jgi:hypothetical protein
MAEYPRLPVDRTVLRSRQFSMLHLMAVMTAFAVCIACLRVGGFPRFAAGVIGAILICFSAAWFTSRLRPPHAVIFTAFGLVVLVVVTCGMLGPVPTFAEALASCFRSQQTELESFVVILSWYAALFLLGISIGWYVAFVRARVY